MQIEKDTSTPSEIDREIYKQRERDKQLHIDIEGEIESDSQADVMKIRDSFQCRYLGSLVNRYPFCE